MSSFKFLFFGWLFASQKKREMHSIFSSRVCIANSRFSGLRTHFVLPSFLRSASELASPVLTILATVCKSNTRN